LQIQHYEKVEGKQLSLNGKANQLSLMVKGHLPAAMQGLAVVPLFAGYDRTMERGRLFQYDVTGGRYEEQEYATSGSGSLHAGTTLKLGYSDDQDRETALHLVVKSLMVAADEDSATGGPDSLRSIYPVVAVIDDDGYERVGDDELATLVDEIRAGGQP
ncbi:MAG: proteasome subunit beta, partial [Acidimicrobiales bacterium]